MSTAQREERLIAKYRLGCQPASEAGQKAHVRRIVAAIHCEIYGREGKG
jgi:hypothetical protein